MLRFVLFPSLLCFSVIYDYNIWPAESTYKDEDITERERERESWIVWSILLVFINLSLFIYCHHDGKTKGDERRKNPLVLNLISLSPPCSLSPLHSLVLAFALFNTFSYALSHTLALTLSHALSHSHSLLHSHTRSVSCLFFTVICQN